MAEASGLPSSVRRILVTGAAGFIGAAVTRELLTRDHRLLLLLRPGSDRRRLAGVLGRVVVVDADLDRPQSYDAAVRAFAPHAVAHLAWTGVGGGSVLNADEQIANVTAATSLYRAAWQSGATAFIGVGTQYEYDSTPGTVSEDRPTRPAQLYGAAKLSTYLLLDRLAERDGVAFAWLRLFFCYGPGDKEDRLLPYLVGKLLRGEKPSLTEGEQICDYVHVEDVARAVAACIGSRPRGAFNLGSGRAVPLRTIIELARDAIDPSLPLGFGDLPYRADQIMRFEADIAALTCSTGWRPSVSLEEGVRGMVAWYRDRPGVAA
jgi:nucleoside-diphosphate-sugar epimerase